MNIIIGNLTNIVMAFVTYSTYTYYMDMYLTPYHTITLYHITVYNIMYIYILIN